MREIKIVIKTTNDAFKNFPENEVARILNDLANYLERGYEPICLLDINGNKVGKVDYK